MSWQRGGRAFAHENEQGSRQLSTRPTGLRPRDTVSRSHPGLYHSSTKRAPASLGTSAVRSSSGIHAPVPVPAPAKSSVTPLPSVTGQSRKRSWISNASKHLGLRKSREKMDLSQDSKISAKGFIAPENESTLAAQPFPASASSASAIAPPRPSPNDKPLPSLPVATVKSGSPVRRSLIDCAERPLRRSLSPVVGQVPEEDWPTIEPSKPGKQIGSHVKPSLGESFIEGMRGLNLGDGPDKEPQSSLKVHFSTPDNAPRTRKIVSKTPDSSATLSVGLNSSDRPLSSSQLPKPRDSMLESLARRIDSPSVRQTKTSAMRLRRSIGKTAWGSNEKKTEKDSRLRAIREKVQSPSKARARQISPGGPFRSNSRGHHALTPRGSPYTVSPRLITKPNKTMPGSENNTDTARHAAITSSTNVHQSQGHEAAVPQQSSSSRNTVRKSSIPLSSRSNHPAPGSISNDATSHESQRLKLDQDENASLQGYKNVAPPGSADMAGTASRPQTNDSYSRGRLPAEPAEPAELLSVKEVLSTPAPCDDDSVSGSEASAASIHGSDSLGGFRIKRVRNTSQGGPTLRITDSASRLLLGEEQLPSDTENGEQNVPLRHKSCAPDLRQPSAVKAQSRRSSALLARPLSFARSITERSQTHVNDSEDEEGRKLIGPSNWDGSGLPAELPGSDVEVEKHPYLQSLTSLDTVEAGPTDVAGTCGRQSLSHGDWPGKELADLTMRADSAPQQMKEKPSSGPTATESSKPSSGQNSVRSRPSTMILRQAPTKEISPFLFQDLEQEKASQGKYLRDMVDQTKGPESNAGTGFGFPPRTSSRKPKPPPIIVSSPEKGPSVSSLPYQDSSRARKESSKLAYSPSSSSKKVISNIRGLFHKRSIEAPTNGKTTIVENKAFGKTPSRPLPGSVRRKPVPEQKLTNPLSSDAQGTAELDTSSTPPNTTVGVGERSVLRNPFISPTTPFTATMRPSPDANSPSLPKLASPALSPRSTTSPGTSPSLSTAASLTHTLLDLARAEASPRRKASLIELSKCMVEVVNSARDAEKAMEKAKMEAARAEVSWLKVQKEVGNVECAVRAALLDVEQPGVDDQTKN